MRVAHFILAAATFISSVAVVGFAGASAAAISGGQGRGQHHVAIFSDVPMTFDGSSLLVPTVIGALDSGPVLSSRFTLDTAANTMIISPAVRSTLGVTDGKQADVVGAGGAAQYEGIEVPIVRVGGLERRKVGALVIDLERFRRDPARPVGGLIGNNFLRDFDTEINIPASRLRLYQPGPSPVVHGFTEASAVSNLAGDPGWIVMQVLVNGKPVRAIVDTAASTSVLNWAAAKQAGVTMDSPALRRRERPTGGLGPGSAETYLFRFDDIRAGQTRFRPEDVRIADLQVFEALGLRDEPAMLFGLDMIRETPMFVSYSSKKIYFGGPRSLTAADVSRRPAARR